MEDLGIGEVVEKGEERAGEPQESARDDDRHVLVAARVVADAGGPDLVVANGLQARPEWGVQDPTDQQDAGTEQNRQT